MFFPLTVVELIQNERNKTLTEAATLKERIRNSQTRLKILGNQNSNANGSKHRESV